MRLLLTNPWALGLTSVSALAIVAVVSCGKEKSDPIAAAVAPEVQGAVSQLVAAYPNGLALSAFPQTTGNAASLTNEAADQKTLVEKSQEAQQRISGEVDDCIPEILKTPPQNRTERETCYQFDHDMIYTNYVNQGRVLGTQDGKSSSGEACLVSFAREQIDGVVDKVDRAMGSIEAMFCQAKKAGSVSALPDVGQELDLKSVLGDLLRNVTEAKIRRLENAEGRPVYRSTVAFSYRDGRDQEVNLVHSPASIEDNSTYNGTLWFKTSTLANEMQNNIGRDHLMSIVYSRVNEDGVAKVKYDLRQASVNQEIADSFISDGGVLELNASNNAQYQYVDSNNAPFGYQNDGASSIRFIAFEIDPETYEGKLSYWQNPGGNYGEAARGFVFNIERSTDDVLVGCATTGAVWGMSIRKALGTGSGLAPTKFWHPFLMNGTPHSDEVGNGFQKDSGAVIWYRPAGAGDEYGLFVANNEGNLVTRQCFRQDPVTGLYELDAAAMDSEPAGYQLITTESQHYIQPPQLQGVQAFQVKVTN